MERIQLNIHRPNLIKDKHNQELIHGWKAQDK
jgi:hypothetical protein